MPHPSWGYHRLRTQRASIIHSIQDFRKSRFRKYKEYFYEFKPACTLSDQWLRLHIDRVSLETLNGRVKRFTLDLPNGIDDNLNLPVTSCLKVRSPAEFTGTDAAVIMPNVYPINDSLCDGILEFIIREPLHRMTAKTEVYNLVQHDYIEINGPVLSSTDESGNDIPMLQYPMADKSSIAMIANGVGITPLIQILKEMSLHSENDTRCVDLLFLNSTNRDYICQSELMSLKVIMKNRLNLFDFFERSKHKLLLTNSWNNNLPTVGTIDKQTMQRLLPKPSKETLILVAVDPENVKLQKVLIKNLLELGYTDDMLHVFQT